MDILHIVTQMLIILSMVMVGLWAAKRGLWAGELDRKLSAFLLNVSMPALIMDSVTGDGLVFEAREVGALAVVSVVMYAVLFALAWAVPGVAKVRGARRGMARFIIAFGNTGFVGYPVCDAIFGSKAVFYVSVLNIPFNVLMYTVGVSFITGGRARWPCCGCPCRRPWASGFTCWAT